MRKIAAAVLSLTILAAAHAAAADRVQAGLWQTTVKSTGSVPPAVTNYCITPAEAKFMNSDAASLKAYLQKSTAEKTAGRCGVSKVEAKANRTVVTMVCGQTTIVGTTVYHGTTYESSTSNGATITGKRVGACTK